MTQPGSWPSIDPGRMIHRVTILQPTAGTDISGATVTWTEFVTAWAAIDPVRGTDIIRSGQDTTQLYLTITMRWQTGILPNMRARSNNGTYIIQAIENPGERNVLLVLTCVALSANQ